MLAPHAMATSVRSRSGLCCHPGLHAGDRQRAGGLEDGAAVLEDVLDRGADLVGAHQHDLVDEPLAQAGMSRRPTRLTAVPSENRPTSASSTGSPAARDKAIALESWVCTPIMRIIRPHLLDVGCNAGDQAASADRPRRSPRSAPDAGAGSPCRSYPVRQSRPDHRTDARRSAPARPAAPRACW